MRENKLLFPNRSVTARSTKSYKTDIPQFRTRWLNQLRKRKWRLCPKLYVTSFSWPLHQNSYTLLTFAIFALGAVWEILEKSNLQNNTALLKSNRLTALTIVTRWTIESVEPLQNRKHRQNANTALQLGRNTETLYVHSININLLNEPDWLQIPGKWRWRNILTVLQ